MVRTLRCLFLILFPTILMCRIAGAQSFVVGAMTSGTYAPGGSIGVPLTVEEMSGCFGKSNKFELWMGSVPGGAPNKKIGDFTGFYTAFVNGIIPAGTIPGTYSMEVRSTAPVQKTALFSVTIGLGAAASANLKFSGLTATAQGVVANCNGFPLTSYKFRSENGNTLTVQAKNELDQSDAGTLTAGTTDETLPTSRAHYTLKSTATSGSLISTKYYMLVNNLTNNQFGASGAGAVCITNGAGTLVYNVDLTAETGIIKNYPGYTYRVSWGDGRTDIYNLCDIRNASGKVTHDYTTESCGKTNNVYSVKIEIVSPFCTGTVGTPISATAKVISPPVLGITGSGFACVGEPASFNNATVLSRCQTGSSTKYSWYVDGELMGEDKPISFLLKQTFNTPGEHKIKLEMQPGGSECEAAPAEFTVMVRAKPQPKFTLPAMAMCTPDLMAPVNQSVVDDQLANGGPSTYIWTVTPATITYANNTNSASEHPEFYFNAPGKYTIKLGINSGACGIVETAEQEVIVNAPPAITMSPDFNTCGKDYTYTFANSPGSKTQAQFSGTAEGSASTFTWTVSGGGYSFENGTSASSENPSIKFTDYGDYTVSVKLDNACGSAQKQQKIHFYNSPSVDAGPDQVVCAGSTVQLDGNPSSSAMVQSVRWIGGSGTFTSRTDPRAIYTPGADEIAAGSVTLTYEVTTVNPAPCTMVSDFVTITIHPKPTISSAASALVCTGNSPAYTFTGPVPGTTFSWTAAASSASITGFTASGNGSGINDVLLNSGTTNGEVVYTITPLANGCPGDPFTYTVTVTPPPGNNVIGFTGGLVCTGKRITIDGSAPNGGTGSYTYGWEKSDDGNTWTAIDNATEQHLGFTMEKLTFFRRTVYSNGCSSISAPIRIESLPPVTGNTISGNQTVCINSIPAPVVGSQPAGGSGTYTYIWQKSFDGGQNWQVISDAIGKDYQSPAMIQTTTFRRIAASAQCDGSQQNISDAVTITVGNGAKAFFTWKNDASCAPFAIDADNIVAQSDPENAVYTWFANDEKIGTGTTFPGYTIRDFEQSATIKLVVTSKLGCAEAVFTHHFSTGKKTTADFALSTVMDCGPLPVAFTNKTSNGAGAVFAWDFGNGKTSAAADPGTIIFEARNDGKDTVYHVLLKVTSTCGISTKSADVTVKAKPFSRFSPDVTTGCSPLLVTFDNSSPGSATEYIWDFGDGETATTTDNKPVPHTYTSTTTRSFTVRMTAKNACGSHTTQYVIRVSPNTVRPAFVVNGDELQGCAPHTVHFSNNSQGANLFGYDFGDGSEVMMTNRSPETIEHTFLKGGTYTVKITASNGCSNVVTEKTIMVYPQPQPVFSADVRGGCSALTVQFSNTSTQATDFLWDFGDGKTSTEKNPVHTFRGRETAYSVRLTATSPLGCTNTVEMKDYIRVSRQPVAAFSILPDSVRKIPDYRFTFADQSKGDLDSLSMHWEFGDGATSFNHNPEHTYADTGRYKVSLIISTAGGCTDTISRYVRITGVPGQLFLPNAFLPNSPDPRLNVFKATGSGLKEWRMRIFNKWGQQIWESTKLDERGRPTDGWDGNVNGVAAPQGVYVWEVTAKYINGDEWRGMTYNKSAPRRTGVINLIR
ncbi:MAG: PKD domain-containing protein [Mucilaginibacter polytrichastri]|nr:PKD domain-containing protein [Mucilaginibacter polytrichastri]